jgi:hypothetical protein
MAVDRHVIEDQLDMVVAKFFRLIAGKEMIPGWRALFMFDVQYLETTKQRVPYLEGEQLEQLLSLAEKWPDAFDAAGYLAGFAVAAGIPMAPNLCLFAAEVLASERQRPKQRGRPLADGKLAALYQIALVRFLNEKADLPIARNRENSGDASFNACQAVAEAFTRAGHRTTFEQVASLIYDAPHRELRETARAIGMLNFNRFDAQ